MSRLIFLNLAIDQLWDPQQNLASLFPARIPESEHLIRINENMGLFLSNPNDLVLGFKETEGYRAFLAERNLKLAPMIEISAHPFDQQQWLQEAFEKAQKQGSFLDLISASTSSLEASLRSHLGLFDSSRPTKTAQTLADFNRKTFLLKLSQKNLLAVPETELLWQKDLVAGNIPAFTDPRILKHDFGSGGAANFSVTGSQDPLFQLLQRRLDPSVQVQWLLQKRMASTIEGSVFSWGDGDEEPASQVALIRYSSQGLSYRHDLQVEEKLQQKARSLLEKVQGEVAAMGYKGPIGLDFLQDTNSDQLFVVDLNLRLTKTHAIAMAHRKFHLSTENSISLRHRWKSQDTLTFQGWWQQCQSDFQLNAKGETKAGDFIIPYLVAGIEAPGGLKEVSVFISRTPGFEKAVLEKWGVA